VKLNLTDEQELLVSSFSRLFTEMGGSTRARERFAPGLDRELLQALAEIGVLAMRSARSEMGPLSVLDAMLLNERAGRALVSLPLTETLIAARLVGMSDAPEAVASFDRIASGGAVATFALFDASRRPNQFVHFGTDADMVVALDGGRLGLFEGGLTPLEHDHGDYRFARFNATEAKLVTLLATGEEARTAHAAAIEEWKLLVAAELTGMAAASLDLAADYAKERHAFGRPIGSFQAIALPLADRAVDVEGSRLLAWWAAWSAAQADAQAPAAVSMAFSWAATAADQTTRTALHTFGGYGLSLEHDAQLFFRRAKARALMLGDPGDELARVSERLWLGGSAPLVDAGDVGIDFALGEEAESIIRDTEALLRDLMTPERQAKMHDSYDGHDVEIAMALAKEGLLFPDWPKEWGGRGVGPVAALAALRTWELLGVAPHGQTVINMVGQMVMHFGSDELKKEALTRIAAGEAPCCMGYSEPSGGSDIFAAQTKATWDEERQVWLINGQKMFTTGANMSDYALMLTRTEPGSSKHKGLTLFLLPMNDPGVEVYPIHTVMDERTNTTFYTDVAVPDSWRIGPVNEGAKVMGAALKLEQAGVYGPGDRRILPCLVEWAKKPDADGRVPFDDRDTRKRIARGAIVAQVGDLLSMRGAWFSEAHPDAGRTAYGNMAKHFYGDRSQPVYADLMDLAAPHTLEGAPSPLATVEHMHRQIQVATIYGGTSEVQRSQIAEIFLGLPRSR